jgi:ribose transport system permease protein
MKDEKNLPGLLFHRSSLNPYSSSLFFTPHPSKSMTTIPTRMWTWLRSLSGPAIGLIFVLGLFIVLFEVKGDARGLQRFLSMSNLQVLLKDISITAVISLGMLLVIISGGIDLSVGSVAALVTVVIMQVYRQVYGGTGSMAMSSLVAVPVGIIVGGICGLVNGLVITRLRVTPFVATLGMLEVARGLAVWLSGRALVDFPGETPGWAKAFAQFRMDYVIFNPGFWSFAILAIGIAILLRYTILGRYCYAIGSNEAGARLCGISISWNKVIIYTLAGLLTGWAGVLMFAQGNSGDPSAGVGLELEVIAAVVIGGASLSGGQGTVLGTFLGVLILGALQNGVQSFQVPVEIKYILIGAIIVVNTALSQWQRRGRV